MCAAALIASHWNCTCQLASESSYPMSRLPGILLSLTGAGLLLTVGLPIQAQYLGLNLRGDVGLKSGSQPGPGYYFVMPLFYQQDYTSVRGPNGNEFPGGFNARQSFFIPAFAVTTKFKVAGANYGFSVVAPIVNQRLDVAIAGVGAQKGAGYNFGDMYVQPVNLGWTTKRADFLAGYGFYAPVGVGSRSLNMWGHELTAGTTVYFDDAKKWHAAGRIFYEIHHQRSTDQIRPGDFLTLAWRMSPSGRPPATPAKPSLPTIRRAATGPTDLAPSSACRSSPRGPRWG